MMFWESIDELDLRISCRNLICDRSISIGKAPNFFTFWLRRRSFKHIHQILSPTPASLSVVKTPKTLIKYGLTHRLLVGLSLPFKLGIRG